ncbi:MAG TPA: hypothetical protein VKX49_28990 [Bryobacteraceae bacterium]|nr:hypothetical protein [Bryobacteraceae bacterium]
MKRLFVAFLVSSLAPVAAAPPMFSEIGAMEQRLSEITGLQFRRMIPYSVMNKEQLRRYLEQRVKDTIKPADIRGEELTLKLLGLVPADFDLRQNTIDLLTEQAAAFYDYNKKKLFMLDDGSGADEEIALVHELAHGLADQHFRLGKYISESMRSDDAATARQAVMEGQASWLMTAYLSKKAGGRGEVSDAVLDLMTHTMEVSPDQYPVYSKSPAYIRDMLVFPYADGMVFQNAVFQKLGQEGFSEVFRRPPSSTQQIIHPDRYLAHAEPQIPDAPEIPAAREFRKLAEGTLGELDYRILVSQYAGKEPGQEMAAHLSGSSYELLEHKHDGWAALAYSSTWDSPESAAKFFEMYTQVLRGKNEGLDFNAQTASKLEGHSNTGYFRVWLDGATVKHLEGWRSPLH